MTSLVSDFTTLFDYSVKEWAKEVAREVAKATNKEAAVEFIEDLAKELVQEIVKELIKCILDAFEEPKQEGREDGEGLEHLTAIEKLQADDKKTPQTVMEGAKETGVEGVKGNMEGLEKIIFDILFGTYEPPVEGAKEGELSQLPSLDRRHQLPPQPAQEDLVDNLLREIESLQRDWMTMSLAEVTESSSPYSWSWTWIIIGGIALIIIVGGSVFLGYRWCHGNGGGARNGGGGAQEDGDGAVVLLGQEVGYEGGHKHLK
jgi:CHASE3 domain sensor protein